MDISEHKRTNRNEHINESSRTQLNGRRQCSCSLAKLNERNSLSMFIHLLNGRI